MPIAYLGLGTNLGDKAENLRRALRLLSDGGKVNVGAVSSLYETRAVGVTDQPEFFNAVISVTTTLAPGELLRLCKEIETQLGRERTFRWGPRVIDIDILLYDDIEAHEDGLTIPHPEMMERAFVLVPLAEVAPDLDVPGGMKAREAADRVVGDGVRRLECGSWSD